MHSRAPSLINITGCATGSQMRGGSRISRKDKLDHREDVEEGLYSLYGIANCCGNDVTLKQDVCRWIQNSQGESDCRDGKTK